MNRSSIRQAISWLLLGGLAWCLYLIFRPFFDPLAWAAILAIFFSRAHKHIFLKLKSPGKAALVSTTLVTLILIVPFLLVIQALISEAVGAIGDAGNIVPRLWDFLHKIEGRVPWDLLPVNGLEQVIKEASLWAKANLGQVSATLAGNLASVSFDVSVTIFALYYFFRYGADFIHRLGRLSTMEDDLRNRLFHDVAETVQVTITSILLVSALQGLLGGLIFLILGLASPVLWSVVMGLASIVPMFGTAMVWGPHGLWLIVTGQTVKGVVLLVYGFLVISSADNILRPILITGRSQINALLVFIGVLGGIQAFGAVGAVLGPVVVSTSAALLSAYEEAKASSLQGEPPPAAAPPDPPSELSSEVSAESSATSET